MINLLEKKVIPTMEIFKEGIHVNVEDGNFGNYKLVFEYYNPRDKSKKWILEEHYNHVDHFCCVAVGKKAIVEYIKRNQLECFIMQ